jgi:biopolymer transport protein ExbB/TolQ|tara:strand:- start:57 stop:440 length:384 start_codon:yes stop_codon:yes gene_type:complete
MQQMLITIILVLGVGSWYLYNQNQTLTANNIKLEYAVEEQKQTMAIMKEQYEKQGEALQNMSRQNAQIEKEKAEYLAIFSRHNLDLLALKKPGMIELRFNNASEAVMEGLEDDTEALYNIDNPNSND